MMKITIRGHTIPVHLPSYRKRMKFKPMVRNKQGDIRHYPFHISRYQMMEAQLQPNALPVATRPLPDGGWNYWADWGFEYPCEQTVGALSKETGMVFGCRHFGVIRPCVFWPHDQMYLTQHGKFVDWFVRLWLEQEGHIKQVGEGDIRPLHKLIDKFYNECYIGTRISYEEMNPIIKDSGVVGEGYERVIGGKDMRQCFDVVGQGKGFRSDKKEGQGAVVSAARVGVNKELADKVKKGRVVH